MIFYCETDDCDWAEVAYCFGVLVKHLRWTATASFLESFEPVHNFWSFATGADRMEGFACSDCAVSIYRLHACCWLIIPHLFFIVFMPPDSLCMLSPIYLAQKLGVIKQMVKIKIHGESTYRCRRGRNVRTPLFTRCITKYRMFDQISAPQPKVQKKYVKYLLFNMYSVVSLRGKPLKICAQSSLNIRIGE